MRGNSICRLVDIKIDYRYRIRKMKKNTRSKDNSAILDARVSALVTLVQRNRRCNRIGPFELMNRFYSN